MPRCRGRKCSVAEGALCASNDQCSCISRTQSSGSGVGDEQANVSQVARDVTRQRPVDKREDLKVNALPHREPVQLAKHWCDGRTDGFTIASTALSIAGYADAL